jgi:hypothetical protein
VCAARRSTPSPSGALPAIAELTTGSSTDSSFGADPRSRQSHARPVEIPLARRHAPALRPMVLVSSALIPTPLHLISRSPPDEPVIILCLAAARSAPLATLIPLSTSSACRLDDWPTRTLSSSRIPSFLSASHVPCPLILPMQAVERRQGRGPGAP